MASTYTDLGIELMETGQDSGVWGAKTNTNLTLVNQAIGGYEAVSIAGGAQTTALAMTDATISNARNAVIEFTGTITGNQIVTIPNSIEKTYIIKNNTTGAFTVEFKTVSGSGYTFAAADKSIRIFYSDGTDIVDTGLLTAVVDDTSPQLGGDLDTNTFDIQFDDAKGIRDDSDNEQLIFQKTASAVNYFEMTNAATGSNVGFSANGSDSNVGIDFSVKGTGYFKFNDAAYNPEQTLSLSGTNVAWNAQSEPVAKVTLTTDVVIASASNGVTGQFISLLVAQDGTGTRLATWNADYEFKDDTAPTLTTTASKGDVFVFRYNGSKWLEMGRNTGLTLS
jgi:hypothetical protein